MIYIAYGSNINLKQMAQRCPTAEKLTTGVIPNYELEFRSVATIVPKENGNVPVLMWDIKPADEKALDRYEGFPRLYRKEYFSLEYGGETHKSKSMVERFAGIVDVPQTRFYTAVDLLDGITKTDTEDETAGGYVKDKDAKNINFMIIHKAAVIQYSKHVVNKIFTPEQNQNADAWQFCYRAYGLTDAYENKAAGIYVHTEADKA